MQNEITENSLYTSLTEAKEEIWARWNNHDLRKKVADFIGRIPLPLQEAPRAVLDRNIATPNLEFLHFIKAANKTGLPPLVTEYIEDKFVTMNDDKRGLGKMPFFKGRDKKGRLLFGYRNAIDCTTFQGKPIGEIKTLWGEDLVEFHHRLLTTTSFDIDFLDASSWYKSNGGHAESYYYNYLALFICHGILFENFITNEEEARFSESVVFPAFKRVVDHFGIKPLIVPLVPHEIASDIYWRCYPAELEEEVSRCLSQCKDNKSSEERQRVLRGKGDSNESPKLGIRNTGKYGLGVFAEEEIKKGQAIHILTGEIISLDECIRRVNQGEEIVDDPLQIGLELYLDLDEFSRAFNHSCAPNAGLRNKSELFALRDIQKGEEITFDYSATVGPNITQDMWTMACTCENKNCRKKIGNILSLPHDTLAKYKEIGALQDYMKVVLNNLGKDAYKTTKK